MNSCYTTVCAEMACTVFYFYVVLFHSKHFTLYLFMVYWNIWYCGAAYVLLYNVKCSGNCVVECVIM